MSADFVLVLGDRPSRETDRRRMSLTPLAPPDPRSPESRAGGPSHRRSGISTGPAPARPPRFGVPPGTQDRARPTPTGYTSSIWRRRPEHDATPSRYTAVRDASPGIRACRRVNPARGCRRVIAARDRRHAQRRFGRPTRAPQGHGSVFLFRAVVRPEGLIEEAPDAQACGLHRTQFSTPHSLPSPVPEGPAPGDITSKRADRHRH
jgi:hypothetical protein